MIDKPEFLQYLECFPVNTSMRTTGPYSKLLELYGDYCYKQLEKEREEG